MCKFIEDKFLLHFFYNVGVILCIFPWNPQGGKNSFQLIANLILFSVACATIYMFEQKKAAILGIEALIYSTLVYSMHISFQLINIYDLIKKRKHFWKLYFYIDNIVNCTLFSSKIKILCYAFISLSVVTVSVFSNWDFFISSFFITTFLGCYWTIIQIQIYVMTGFLLEISLILKKREDIICERLQTFCKQPYFTKRDIICEIQMLKNTYKYFGLVVLSLNAAFGKKMLVYLLLVFVTLLGIVDYVLDSFNNNEGVHYKSVLENLCYLLLIMVSFSHIKIVILIFFT